MQIPAPLEGWGLVKIARPPFPIGKETIVKGKPCNPIITVNEDGSISVRGQNYQYWSAIQLLEPGNYTVNVVKSGMATAGKGDNAKNTVNLRFTTGKRALDCSKVYGNNCKSSAGKLQTNGNFSDSDRLNISGPIRIYVTELDFRVYHNRGQLWYSCARNGKPVLIGFKTCTLILSKEKEETEGKEAVSALGASAAARNSTMEDLTPQALMKQLQGLAMKEAANK